jgi:hypothetical protein
MAEPERFEILILGSKREMVEAAPVATLGVAVAMVW